jgi:C4-dicarboxylate-specific signal transduction histidine kinase
MSGRCINDSPTAVAEVMERPLICRADGEGILTFVNDAYCEAFGRSRQELLGCSFWTLIPNHEHARIRQHLAHLTPAEPAGTIAHLIHADTGHEWIQRWIDFGRFDPQGRVVEWLSIGVHSTGTRELAGGESVEAITRDLRQEVDALGAMGTLGVLAGSIAHELNQPLSSIAANAHSAIQALEAERPDVDGMREALQDIGEDTRRAGILMRQFVECVKHQRPSLGRLDVNVIAADVVRRLLRRDRSPAITIELQLAPGLPAVLGNPVQIEQVIMNLLVNACESVMASDLSAARRNIVLRTDRRCDEVCVSVIDRGRGVSPEEVQRIFEPFYTTKGHGMGLGLAISRRIVTLHHGRMYVERNEDGGATFAFTLRAVAAVRRAAASG